jgi:nicotinate-nucleotide pyrophosphorylase (carboxylating)
MPKDSLLPADWRRIMELALAEDLGTGDITVRACIPIESQATARLIAKQELILAGIDVAKAVFKELDPDCRVISERSDGKRIADREEILVVSGSAAKLLMAERTALNFLQRLSGVATLTDQYAHETAHTKARIVDTRKTTPGMRSLEKYAVRCGGGHNHRVGLFDGILIKENHIRAAGGIGQAIVACKQEAHHLMRVEVEVTNLNELEEALAAQADVIMLDNFTRADILSAVSISAGRALLEVSGGVNLATVRALAETGVDLISVGRLTHSAPAADISMLFDCAPHD